MNTYNKLADFYKKIRIMENISGILQWDSSTMMPNNSFRARSEELSFLSSMQQKFLRSERLGHVLERIEEEELNDWQKANVREIRLNRANALAVDTKLVELLTKASTEGKVMWKQARKAKDFKIFAPQLKKIISLSRDIGKARQEYFKRDTAYDGLLDQYDQDSTQKDLDKIVVDLRDWLPGAIDQAITNQKSKKIIGFDQDFSVEKQKELAVFCMKKLGFDFNRGRLDVSVHPFCGGSAFDVRLTTRYDVKNFITGLLGITHETGHALYQQNLPENYKDQAVGNYRSISIHESQSLFIEKHISSSLEFWEYITPHIHKILKLPHTNKAYSCENFYNINNRVERSFIRVDADEVTYPAHVILRYDIEKELISGNLQVNDIPQKWNEGMKELLGITPQDDAEGCLQDIHWSMGAFGYFPTYLKGSIFASQIAETIKHKEKDFYKYIREGQFKPIVDFLKNNVHSKGCYFTSDELIKSVVGKSLDVNIYKQYLSNKFLN